MFAGVAAATADLDRLELAKRMAAAGEGPRQIHAVSGWFLGGDGHWRFEVNDAEATLLRALRTLRGGGFESMPVTAVDWRQCEDGCYDLTLCPPAPETTSDFAVLCGLPWEVVLHILPRGLCAEILAGKGEPSLIGDFEEAYRLSCDFRFEGMNMLPLRIVLRHEGLFAAYPALADLPVQVEPGRRCGGALVTLEDGRDVIRLGPGQQLCSMLHELQHAVQQLEGFSLGGSVEGLRTVRDRLCEVKGQTEVWLDGLMSRRDDLARAAYRLLDAGARQALLQQPGLASLRQDLYERDDDFFRDLALNLDAYGGLLTGGSLDPVVQALASLNGQIRHAREDMGRTSAMLVAFEDHGLPGVYHRLHGEVEARLTAGRGSMSAFQRALAWPLDMADVPPEAVLRLELMHYDAHNGPAEGVSPRPERPN